MDEKILQTNWDTVKERVSSLKNLSDRACNTWIKPLQLYGIEEDEYSGLRVPAVRC